MNDVFTHKKMFCEIYVSVEFCILQISFHVIQNSTR